MTNSLEFYGAAGEVTGSCHVLRVGGRSVLLDCGMIQGGRRNEARNRDPFPFDPADIDAVVLSHAHLDHSGRLPLLRQRGFRGTIHTQNASAGLVPILLADAASLAERDATRENIKRARSGRPPVEPLFTASDAAGVERLLRGHIYGEPFEVVPGLQATFHDAGHIIGSACVQLRVETANGPRTLTFSGDLGQYDTPILEDPVSPKGSDLVLMESTYGGRLHRERSETVAELGHILKRAAETGGNIIVPAFAIGRSQELLYLLGKHADDWQVDRWRIFLDSPMAIEASEVYWSHKHLHDDEARRLSDSEGMPPLDNLYLTRSPAESRVINRLERGALIIAGSGMCNGGRVLHHLKHNLWRRNAHVVIVGWQAPGSLGRRLVDRHDSVRIHGETIRVRAQIHTVGGLSAHGDAADLSRWYGGLGGTPPVWLVHGEPDSGEALADRLQRDHGCRVTQPRPGDRINLDTLA
ncbi:MAG: MBL fold metallo-hydrolase [Pseudomonadota bacterium]